MSSLPRLNLPKSSRPLFFAKRFLLRIGSAHLVPTAWSPTRPPCGNKRCALSKALLTSRSNQTWMCYADVILCLNCWKNVGSFGKKKAKILALEIFYSYRYSFWNCILTYFMQISLYRYHLLNMGWFKHVQAPIQSRQFVATWPPKGWFSTWILPEWPHFMFNMFRNDDEWRQWGGVSTTAMTPSSYLPHQVSFHQQGQRIHPYSPGNQEW